MPMNIAAAFDMQRRAAQPHASRRQQSALRVCVAMQCRRAALRDAAILRRLRLMPLYAEIWALYRAEGAPAESAMADVRRRHAAAVRVAPAARFMHAAISRQIFVARCRGAALPLFTETTSERGASAFQELSPSDAGAPERAKHAERRASSRRDARCTPSREVRALFFRAAAMIFTEALLMRLIMPRFHLPRLRVPRRKFSSCATILQDDTEMPRMRVHARRAMSAQSAYLLTR